MLEEPSSLSLGPSSILHHFAHWAITIISPTNRTNYHSRARRETTSNKMGKSPNGRIFFTSSSNIIIHKRVCRTEGKSQKYPHNTMSEWETHQKLTCLLNIFLTLQFNELFIHKLHTTPTYYIIIYYYLKKKKSAREGGARKKVSRIKQDTL